METSPEMTRRGFIQSTAGSLLFLASQAKGKNATPAARSKSWVIACRDNLLKTTGQPDCWSAMRELGVTGVEVDVNPDMDCPGFYHPSKKYSLATDPDMQVLKDDLSNNGLVITAFLMHNRFDERLEQEMAWTRKLVATAQKLEVRVIRIDVVSRRTQREEFLPFAVRVCKRLCGLVEGTPIRYGIENHGSITNDPEFLGQLFDGVGSPQLGLTLDTANFYWYGHPLDELYKIFERFAPKVFHTHCKSIHYPDDRKNVHRPMGWEYGKYNCPIYEGDIDFRRVAAILRKANYRGDLCVENESLGKYPEKERAEIVKKEIALLRTLSKAE